MELVGISSAVQRLQRFSNGRKGQSSRVPTTASRSAIGNIKVRYVTLAYFGIFTNV
jgi:hypothetical protein